MTVSVCMGIYNGEQYIQEQLVSILEQTRRPDEVILCDDNSTDSTIQIVQAFIKENHLEGTWFLYQNNPRKGYPYNFYYAMNLCKGDVVFLADQDDIWHADKIKRMTEVFEQHNNVKAVCCKFDLINEYGKQIHTIMRPAVSKESSKVSEIILSRVFYKWQWPGMVLAYRNKWYQEKNKFQEHSIPHDVIVCTLAAEGQGFVQLDETLAYHRRHNNNTGGEEHRLGRLLNKARKVKEIEDYLRILRYLDEKQLLISEAGQAFLKDKLNSMQDRLKALCSGKISKVLKNAWRYRGMVRIATVVCDMVIVGQKE